MKTALTAKELEILQLIKEGLSSKEIAALLFISPNTVDNHRANMLRKLGLNGKNALLRYALQQSLF